MSTITNSQYKTRKTQDLRQWIAAAGKYSIVCMKVWKHRNGGAFVWTKFSNGDVYTDRWASFSVFEDFVQRRSRNFKGVTYEVYNND